jgi:hypothetical protein
MGPAFILLFVVLLVATVAAIAHNAYSRAAGAVLELSRKVIAETSEKTVDRTVYSPSTTARPWSAPSARPPGCTIPR